jgi:hypothetical protein
MSDTFQGDLSTFMTVSLVIISEMVGFEKKVANHSTYTRVSPRLKVVPFSRQL